ncbi:right-handed parallel beta-helix repeat-containing protein [Kineococcus sp. TRM81007]|uniref:right-handed parallel beta-helix repeat-containing protein n=1 Tax=Kineococcus sp. TRM81007 TaxID=2925831 RepID=UPI001F5778AA|nr:right-handed parallel beta-helix repeat-containing protein [Kineococcus sp. TRM81007]MCI2237841.1 right-handed parallel beta-helix repeat-containing protein [Kineococcus sp. TRM81007]
MVPAALVVVAVTFTGSPQAPKPEDYSPIPLPKTDHVADLRERELDWSLEVKRITKTLDAPQVLVGPPGTLPVVAVQPREQAWTLSELVAMFPTVLRRDGDAVLLEAGLFVPEGATLEITGAEQSEVRLSSTERGSAAIISRDGHVRLRGSEDEPLRVTSWDTEAGAPDADLDDGRSFVLTIGGEMHLDGVEMEHLGFGTGTTSGVAWRGASAPSSGGEAEPARGTVVDSVFRDNWFGAYTFEAVGMQWVGNEFVDNAAYGFDPHDMSNDFLVEGNVAHGNGRHGFIFSRGCVRNVLRGNLSYDNRGHGFMIDDGRSVATANAEANVMTSDYNVLIDNVARDNDGAGVLIEGGVGNLVEGNTLERNYVGVRVKDGAQARVADNVVHENRLYGVHVLENADTVEVAGNDFDGSWGSVGVGRADAAVISDNTYGRYSVPLTVAGVSRELNLSPLQKVQLTLRWNPLLFLWSLVLGVPLVIALAKAPSLVTHRVRRWSLR